MTHDDTDKPAPRQMPAPEEERAVCHGTTAVHDHRRERGRQPTGREQTPGPFEKRHILVTGADAEPLEALVAEGRDEAMTPEALRALADEIESRDCNGVAASWCPIHGDCRGCTRHEDGDWDTYSGACPLHADASAHATASASKQAPSGSEPSRASRHYPPSEDPVTSTGAGGDEVSCVRGHGGVRRPRRELNGTP